MNRYVIVLLVASVIVTACGQDASADQPTAIIAATKPAPMQAAITTQEPISTPEPIITPCTPDDAYSDYEERQQLYEAERVTLLEVGFTYSVWQIAENQVCVGIGEMSTDLFFVTTRWESDFGLTDFSTHHVYADDIGVTGKFRKEEVKTSYSDEILSYYFLEEPEIEGPNDHLVVAAWPSQKAAINAEGRRWYTGDVMTDYFDDASPAMKCFEMGWMEQIAPLPDAVSFCRQDFSSRIELRYVGGFTYIQVFGGPENNLGIMVFYDPPETVFDGDVVLKYGRAGYLTEGQNLGGLIVKESCATLEQDDYRRRSLLDPVLVTFANGDGDELNVPRGAWIGVGTEDGNGYDKIYKVCP